ncbi:hypothetical protein [Fundicoccus culcitae]|uniref:Uncharacterized protein n=1 Tax=Fundicoccus culcitae TaxID=2969821 RepID=A0ABY5P5G9_9LACT|nr:hypothetical protein [Fundicoccus culcitae]UUX33998.1 hypothetical protein NRE15_14120 [Fundicoccus culcitae]
MTPFSMGELLLYLYPLVMYVIIEYFFKDYFSYFSGWPLSYSVIFIPSWLVIIYWFGRIIFQLNILPLAIFLTTFVVAVHLYQYVRTIDEFTYQAYYPKVTKIIFTSLSAFLLGLILIRFYEYYHLLFT